VDFETSLLSELTTLTIKGEIVPKHKTGIKRMIKPVIAVETFIPLSRKFGRSNLVISGAKKIYKPAIKKDIIKGFIMFSFDEIFPPSLYPKANPINVIVRIETQTYIEDPIYGVYSLELKIS
jgi:hypothetical protein